MQDEKSGRGDFNNKARHFRSFKGKQSVKRNVRQDKKERKSNKYSASNPAKCIELVFVEVQVFIVKVGVVYFKLFTYPMFSF